jgi:hypothetical protein
MNHVRIRYKASFELQMLESKACFGRNLSYQ